VRKVRCIQGHFFDADANAVCPHCGSPENKESRNENDRSSEGEVNGTKGKRSLGLFGRRKKSSYRDDFITGHITVSSETSVNSEGSLKSTENSDINSLIKPDGISEPLKRTMTEAIWDNGNVKRTMTEVHDENGGNAVKNLDSIKTISIYTNAGGTEPVTGWLVCTEGNNRGRSFEIKAGQNCIGRDSSMDICIKEEGITRERHAYIIFEPKKRQFYLRGGDGSGLSYCNDEMVVGMQQINAYDKIQLGNANFMFIPFCGERYMWDESK